MIAIVWRYVVKDEHRDAFEAAYGPDGDWARLFARGDGFRGTQLMRGGGGTYLTIDRWRDAADFQAFLAEHAADYDALDARTQGWTATEQRLGDFELVD